MATATDIRIPQGSENSEATWIAAARAHGIEAAPYTGERHRIINWARGRHYGAVTADGRVYLIYSQWGVRTKGVEPAQIAEHPLETAVCDALAEFDGMTSKEIGAFLLAGGFLGRRYAQDDNPLTAFLRARTGDTSVRGVHVVTDEQVRFQRRLVSEGRAINLPPQLEAFLDGFHAGFYPRLIRAL